MGSKEGSKNLPWDSRTNRIKSANANVPPHADPQETFLDVCARCGESATTHTEENTVCRAFKPLTQAQVDAFEAETTTDTASHTDPSERIRRGLGRAGMIGHGILAGLNPEAQAQDDRGSRFGF